MNKELGRKITSLTLMTIMLTWTAAMGFSMTFLPEAEAANNSCGYPLKTPVEVNSTAVRF